MTAPLCLRKQQLLMLRPKRPFDKQPAHKFYRRAAITLLKAKRLRRNHTTRAAIGRFGTSANAKRAQSAKRDPPSCPAQRGVAGCPAQRGATGCPAQRAIAPACPGCASNRRGSCPRACPACANGRPSCLFCLSCPSCRAQAASWRAPSSSPSCAPR